jgi:hypothetical protein
VDNPSLIEPLPPIPISLKEEEQDLFDGKEYFIPSPVDPLPSLTMPYLTMPYLTGVPDDMPSQGIMDPPSLRTFKGSTGSVGTLGSGFEARGRQRLPQPQGFTPSTKLLPRCDYDISMTPLSVANPSNNASAGSRQGAIGGAAQAPSIPLPRTLGAPIFPGPDAFQKSKHQSIYLLPRTERSPVPFLPDALYSTDEEHLFPRPLGPPRLDPRSTLPWEVHNLAPIF